MHLLRKTAPNGGGTRTPGPAAFSSSHRGRIGGRCRVGLQNEKAHPRGLPRGLSGRVSDFGNGGRNGTQLAADDLRQC